MTEIEQKTEELKRELSSERWIRVLEIADGLLSRGYIDEEAHPRAVLHFAKLELEKEKTS